MLQIPLALWVMGTPEVNANRLLAKTPASMLMLCISAGYFLYDAAVSILRYEGIAYLMHGVVACILYTYGALTGFLSYYGPAASTAAALCCAEAVQRIGPLLRQPSARVDHFAVSRALCDTSQG